MSMIDLTRRRGASPAHRGDQAGVTLVELMVTIAINLLLVLAATLLYLNTRNTQKAVDERGAVFLAPDAERIDCHLRALGPAGKRGRGPRAGAGTRPAQ